MALDICGTLAGVLRPWHVRRGALAKVPGSDSKGSSLQCVESLLNAVGVATEMVPGHLDGSPFEARKASSKLVYRCLLNSFSVSIGRDGSSIIWHVRTSWTYCVCILQRKHDFSRDPVSAKVVTVRPHGTRREATRHGVLWESLSWRSARSTRVQSAAFSCMKNNLRERERTFIAPRATKGKGGWG